MNMTNYMELLATNQPFNLLLFMAVPIVLVETVAVTELYILYNRDYKGPVRILNRLAGIAVGVYFTGVFIYLMMNAVVPLTRGGGWRGPIDVVAVGAYLLGVIPLAGIAALDLGLLVRRRDAHSRMAIHASLVAMFLVVGHVAMIAGMMDPTLAGYSLPTASTAHH